MRRYLRLHQLFLCWVNTCTTSGAGYSTEAFINTSWQREQETLSLPFTKNKCFHVRCKVKLSYPAVQLARCDVSLNHVVQWDRPFLLHISAGFLSYHSHWMRLPSMCQRGIRLWLAGAVSLLLKKRDFCKRCVRKWDGPEGTERHKELHNEVLL